MGAPCFGLVSSVKMPLSPKRGALLHPLSTLPVSIPSVDPGYDVRHKRTGGDHDWDDEDGDVAWTSGDGEYAYAITGLAWDTTYDVQMRAVNDDVGAGRWSRSARGTTLAPTPTPTPEPTPTPTPIPTPTPTPTPVPLPVPDMPTGLTAEARSMTSILLRWEAVTGAARYRIERSTGASGPWHVVTEYNTTPYRTLTDLRCGTTYHVRVSAHGDGVTHAAGWSEPSAPRSATPPCPLPERPTGLTAEARSATAILLRWDAVTGAVRYRIERSSSASGPWHVVTEYNTTPYRTLTGLRCGTTYHARVSAYGDGSTRAASWSEPSEPRSATPPCPPSIEIASLADDLEVGESDVFRVRASHLNPAHAYAIRITTGNADMGFNASCSDREETARVSGVTSYRRTLTLHGCRVTTGAVTATLERGSTRLDTASQRVTVEEPLERPSEPTGFVASAGNTQVWLRWDDPGDGTITGWRYWIREGRGRTEWRDVPGSGADTTSHRVTGLSNGIEYRFRVRAVNEAGEGPHSDPLRVTPRAALPAKPAGFAVASGEGEVVLGWDDPLDASITGYRYSVDGGTTWIDVAGSGPGTTAHAVGDLSSIMAYVFAIRAVNAEGAGPSSEAVIASPG